MAKRTFRSSSDASDDRVNRIVEGFFKLAADPQSKKSHERRLTARPWRIVVGISALILGTLLVSLGVADQKSWALAVLLELSSWILFGLGLYLTLTFLRDLRLQRPD